MLCLRRLHLAAVVASLAHCLCAAAQDAHCTSELRDADIRGNLNITARCQLVDTTIRGNVRVFAGGALIARDAELRGNLDAERADFVDIEDSEIAGNVNLRELVGDATSITETEIDGNASLTDNRSALRIINNDFGGNVKVTGNGGGVLISGNSVDGNLECSGNSPSPNGVGNRVDRRAQGQCERILPTAAPPPPAQPSSPPAPTQPPVSRPPSTPAPPVTETPPPAATPPAGGGGAASRDVTPPTLTLRGAPRVTVSVGSPYVDAGATAIDSTDGDLTSRIVATNPVNTALIGTFTITYAVSDRSGNAATPLTRTVTVAAEAAEGGGGGAVGIEVAWALLLLAMWRAVRPCSIVSRPRGA